MESTPEIGPNMLLNRVFFRRYAELNSGQSITVRPRNPAFHQLMMLSDFTDMAGFFQKDEPQPIPEEKPKTIPKEEPKFEYKLMETLPETPRKNKFASSRSELQMRADFLNSLLLSSLSKTN